ncbi:MAG: phosphatase [Oscillospiraceae bacterium]|jgi:putative hydrolase|nr:phosphatase [Oscillospiraceae bacterium]
MKIVADMHCHSLASGHAYSSIQEMIDAAYLKGLWAIAITDHGRATPNSPGAWHFENLRTIPKKVNNVWVLKGIEANIWDYDGNLDTSNLILDRLDWVVASMHAETLRPVCDIDACTNAWLNIVKNPYVNVIGHSGEEAYKYDYEKVIPEFSRMGKLVEINNGSFLVRKTAIKNCKKIALLCKKYGVKVIVNSDAHFSTLIGNISSAGKLLEEIDFPLELIINNDKLALQEYIKTYTKFFN